GLGSRLPRADGTGAVCDHETRLAAGATGWLVDPHHCLVQPVSWRVGPLGYGLPGLGSVCLATSSEFTNANRGLITPKVSLQWFERGVRMMAIHRCTRYVEYRST